MEGTEEITESEILSDLMDSDTYEEFQEKMDVYEGWLQFLGTIVVQRRSWELERDEFNANSRWGVKL